ncbi:glutaredoxin family protein [Streptomyces sp. NPDC001978]|uniref:glutaredoxin family protein n=1 Tax=Streptomyces sp. NPDC001978 TaxID=3364627 RepID=UPI0036B38E99
MIALTLLTQADCAWCERAKKLLAETDADVEVTEVSLDTDEGRELAARHRLLFAPGLVRDDQLIAYGRISKRALRRELDRIPQS